MDEVRGVNVDRRHAWGEKLAGVASVLVTPFRTDGSFDAATFGTSLDRMSAAGVPAVMPNGNTGEFFSLSRAEQIEVIEIAGAYAAQLTVITGVGGDLEGATGLARQAAASGLQAVLVHGPLSPFWSQQGWIDYHAGIADAVPELAVIPYFRNASITADTLGRLAERCGNVVGVKYAVQDVIRFAELVKQLGGSGLTWLCGLAESWAPFFWTAGATGFTSGIANFRPDLSLRMYELLSQGDTGAAMDLWLQLRQIETMRLAANQVANVSVVKEAMAVMGLCGNTVRPPSSLLDADDRRRVAEVLAAWARPAVAVT